MCFGDWYSTFRDSVMEFERRHPVFCRHIANDGDFNCTTTSAYKLEFFSLFEQYKILHFYLFIFFAIRLLCILEMERLIYQLCITHVIDKQKKWNSSCRRKTKTVVKKSCPIPFCPP